MFYKTFYFKMIIRVVFLFITLTTLAFIFGKMDLFFNQLILLGIIAIQFFEMIRFATTTNRELSKFILALRHADYAMNFKQSKLGKSFNLLNESFVTVINTIKESKIEKEAQFQFLQMLVQKVPVGLISIKDQDQIYFINSTATELLDIPKVKSWEELAASAPQFVREIKQLGQQSKSLVKIKRDANEQQLSVTVSHMVLVKSQYTLITFQDIRKEIDQKEIEAWNKLIRILTHEIMNSLTPVSSLTETMIMLMEDEEGKAKRHQDLTDEAIEDIRFSLKTIQKRNAGMLQFVDDYRRLTKISPPKLKPIGIAGLFENIQGLMKAELANNRVKLETKVDPNDLSIDMDQGLMEQVLINMIGNAIHALEKTVHPKIELKAFESEGHPIIRISDNGEGIDEDKLENIFIPFFSTREDGSGIGLSLSKQIILLHGGNIEVISKKDQETSFYLVFSQQE